MQRWLWKFVPPALVPVACLIASFAFADPLPNAWQINSTGSPVNYTNDLSGDLQIAATNITGGFNFTINARLFSGSSSNETIAMAYGLGTNRFLISFFLDDAGDLTADLDGSATFTLTTNGTGTALYHYHEILYDPATGLASYLFDGRVMTTNWAPAGNSLTNGQVFWGAANSSDAGTMNFHSVVFKVTNTVVAAYDAGAEPDTAQDPTNAIFGWGLSGPDSTSVGAVSPDTVPVPTYPLPTTLDATNVSTHQATLLGLVDQGNLAAAVWFEWGTDTNYGNTTPPQPLLSDTNDYNLSQSITGLAKGTTYHFRCIATNLQGIAYGQDFSFTTPVAITVTNSADAGPGTLRQAIADSVSGDVIVIASTVGTITLANGELLITNDLTIAEAGAAIAIDAGGNSRVLEIASSNTVTLDSLIITNGHVSDFGGGILENEGANLIITNCTVTGNSADMFGGGLYATNSTITINNSTFSENSTSGGGGGIANDGSVLVASGSSFASNSAAAGGGICNQNNGIVTIDDSTLSSNTATNFGGGIISTNGCTATINNSTISDNACPSDQGGGIDNWGTFTINNCTVVGNDPGGGFVNTYGIAACNNSTFSANVAIFDGGGFYSFLATNTLINCTVSGNSASRRGGGFHEDTGSFSALTNTIIAGNTAAIAGPDLFGPISGANNLTNGDPVLAPLGDYGGPTQTMPPLGGSPAINAGDDSVTNLFMSDQRGYPRLASAHVDIGAVEIQPAMVINTNDDGPGSLRAVAASDPALIAFTNTLSGQTIQLATGQITLSNSVGIDASMLAGGILIDAGASSRVLEITAGNTVTLDSLTITNGNVSDIGGGILVGYDATLIVNNCTVAGNFAEAGGGIFDSSNSTVVINSSTFSTNSASSNGGGIENDQAALTIDYSVFSGNSATNNGGAIDSGTNGSMVVNNSSFSGNSASAGGGILVDSDATLMLSNCIVGGNFAATGGGIFNSSNSTVVINSSTFSTNSASSGGGIENDQAALTINNSIFSSNYATNNGGAIENSTNSSMVVNNSSFSGNSANAGGALYNDGGTAVLNYSTLSANSTTSDGGGLWNDSTVSFNNCTLFGNSAGISNNGGGIYNNSGTNTLNNCTVTGNSAGNGGGVFQDASGTSLLTNTIVAGNSATNTPDIFGPFSGANNLTAGNPLLAPFSNYGGPLQTMPPLAGSAAIDAGTDSVTNLFTTDERGFARLSGAHVDIGAVEAQLAPASNRPVLKLIRARTGGGLSLNFTNVPNADFTVLASTNLALPLNQWTVLGPAIQNPPGQYQFTDSISTNFRVRFYQAVSP